MANKEYAEKYPWRTRYSSAKQRCENPKVPEYYRYGGKGIKCLMTMEDFKYLWFRDKAYELKIPSIDRIDSNGHYELTNCRFIELSENVKRVPFVPPYGEKSGTSKLKNEQVLAIRQEYKTNKSFKGLAKKYSVSPSNIYYIVTRRSWKHI